MEEEKASEKAERTEKRRTKRKSEVINKMCEIECQYKQNCISYPHKCNTCSNNKTQKKDYYVPENPWYPWYPYYPYYWQTTISVYSDDAKTDFYTTCGEK